jgi:predicted secreted protein
MTLRARSATPLLVLAIAGCGGGGGGGTKTAHEPRGTVSVDHGQTLVLAFSTNPGVGFDWERGTPNPDAAVLRARGSRSANADRPGASAEISYRFQARRAGTAAIGFVHFFRGKVVERRTVRVTVR